jgi:GST-like protein
MIDLYYWPTPNGWKVTIMLEECGLPYTIKPVNIGRGDQLTPSFLKLSPNGRMPAIVDHEPMGGGAPQAIFESGAIVMYLAEKVGKFWPREPTHKYEVAEMGDRAVQASGKCFTAGGDNVRKASEPYLACV